MDNNKTLPLMEVKGQELDNSVVATDSVKQVSPAEECILIREHIYALTFLLEHKYGFARIKVNRDIDNKVVNQKKASIRAAKGIITPFLVISAKECIDSGIEVVDYDGNSITKDTPDLDKILVIVDGQHRWEAIKALAKDGENYEAYFILPLSDDYDLMTMLKEINTSVNPWDGIDWLTMAIQTAKDKGLETSKLEWLKKLANTEHISDSAASLYASRGERIYSKSLIKSAIDSKDNEKLENLTDTVGLERNRNLYEALISTFNVKTVGLKITPKTLYGFIGGLVSANMPINDAYAKVIGFVKSLSKTQIEFLDGAKKTESKTKDQVISSLFK